MKRAMEALPLVLASVFGVAADEPKKAQPAKVESVPDPSWQPKPGDRVEVFVDEAPSCLTYAAYEEFLKRFDAKDTKGLDELYARKFTVKLPKGTPILVIKRHKPEPVSNAGRTYSLSGFRDALQANAMQPQPKPGEYPLEVRVLDGELKDQIRFMPEETVARMIPIRRRSGASSTGSQSRPQSKAIDPSIRAAGLLRSAQNLERAKKPDGALAFYRQILKEFPETPQAKTAAERIKALTGK